MLQSPHLVCSCATRHCILLLHCSQPSVQLRQGTFKPTSGPLYPLRSPACPYSFSQHGFVSGRQQYPVPLSSISITSSYSWVYSMAPVFRCANFRLEGTYDSMDSFRCMTSSTQSRQRLYIIPGLPSSASKAKRRVFLITAS